MEEAKNRANAKYRGANVNAVNVRFYPADAELWNWMTAHGYRAAWLKEIAREAYEAEKTRRATMKATYILTASERVLRLEGNGDVHDLQVNPYADPDVIYEGPSLDEARAAAAEFMDENPCEFIAQGLGAVVAYHELECNLIYEDGEGEDAFKLSTLTEAARERLYAYADGIDEAAEEMDE